MTKFNVLYSDISMIDAHLLPYEREFTADNDPEITRNVLAWIAKLHGMPANSLTLENPTADYSDVLTASAVDPEKIGEVTFIQEENTP